jgi:hypothetical protein
MTVNLHQQPKNLQQIGASVAANPTIGKRVRHSGPLAGFRRAVQSKGAFASATAGAVQKGVSIAFGQIPVPGVGMILDKAWGLLGEKLRTYHVASHLKAPANPADKVKFELKHIGEMVADWDGYRWKVNHAVEQYNKTAAEFSKTATEAPCDSWVRMWAKFYYLISRVDKLRESVEAVRAICDATDEWLVAVETNVKSAHETIKTQYEKEVGQLKQMQVHDTCSDAKCMFKPGSYLAQASVPTSGAALFMIKGVSAVSKMAMSDPLGDTVDTATSI